MVLCLNLPDRPVPPCTHCTEPCALCSTVSLAIPIHQLHCKLNMCLCAVCILQSHLSKMVLFLTLPDQSVLYSSSVHITCRTSPYQSVPYWPAGCIYRVWLQFVQVSNSRVGTLHKDAFKGEISVNCFSFVSTILSVVWSRECLCYKNTNIFYECVIKRHLSTLGWVHIIHKDTLKVRLFLIHPASQFSAGSIYVWLFVFDRAIKISHIWKGKLVSMWHLVDAGSTRTISDTSPVGAPVLYMHQCHVLR